MAPVFTAPGDQTGSLHPAKLNCCTALQEKGILPKGMWVEGQGQDHIFGPLGSLSGGFGWIKFETNYEEFPKKMTKLAFCSRTGCSPAGNP